MSPITTTLTTLDDIRQRAVQLLQREGRAIHTGEIAVRLDVKTNDVHLALDPGLRSGEFSFVSSEGWALRQNERPARSDDQRGLSL